MTKQQWTILALLGVGVLLLYCLGIFAVAQILLRQNEQTTAVAIAPTDTPEPTNMPTSTATRIAQPMATATRTSLPVPTATFVINRTTSRSRLGQIEQGDCISL